MMKKVIFLGLVIGILAYMTLNFHFILMDDKVKLLKKAEMTFAYTWVDARGAKKFKLLVNPALVKAGFNEVVKDARNAVE